MSGMRQVLARVAALSAATMACLLLCLAFVGAAALGWGPPELAEHGLASIPWLAVGFTPAGAILAWQRSRNPIGWLMLATGLVAAVAVASIPGTAVAAEQDWPLWLQLTLANVSFSAWSLWLILIPLTLLCFPAGRLGTWPVRVIAIITIVGGTGILLLSLADPGIDAWVAGFDIPADGPLFAAGSIAVLGDTVVASALPLLPLLFVVQSAAFVGMVVVLTARFARGDDRVRQQLFWILLSALSSVILLGTGVVAAVFGPAFGLLALLLPPIGILIAIMRVNLFDVKLVFSRALAWSILTTVLVIVFFALVAVLGTLLVQTASAVIAALAVALVFEPLRRVFQRLVDRLIYGRRSEPVYLVELVGSGISRAGDLPSLVSRLADSLKLPWLAIRAGERILTASGTRPAVVEIFPLRHGADEVGSVEVGLRRGQGRLGRPDREVMDLLTPFLAMLLQLTAVSEDLAASRGRIVAATEEERRRLQGDLHDGVASALGGVAFKIEGIRNRIHQHPREAIDLLAGVHDDVVRANSTLREVIHDLHPTELDTLGLVGAIREATASLQPRRETSDRVVTVNADPERMVLPAAVEVAVYRIVIEATTNALRHSAATGVTIDLTLASSVISITVHDNAARAGEWTTGVGLRSMRDRTEQLGGRFHAGPSATGGIVEAVIPVRETAGSDA